MRKVIIGIFALAYLSGISTLVLGHFLHVSPNPSEIQIDFIDEVKDYSWVKHGEGQGKELLYYKQITYLYAVDERMGPNLLNADWLEDSITEEEAHALSLLVALLEEDPDIAVRVSRSVWFQRKISSNELDLMEKTLALTQENLYLAKNITSSNWFIYTGTHKADEGISTVMDMPSDLALAASFAPWFKADTSLSELETLQELITLYNQDKNLALTLPSLYQPQDFESLQHINNLYATDKELAELFFLYNTLSRESFLALSDLSRIAARDREQAHSLVEKLTQDKIQIISSLAAIYASDPAMGKFASETFGNNKTALIYVQKALEIGTYEPELLERGGLFVSDNPEFIYEDRIESYRYHLLAEILSEILPEKAQEYKNLVFVTCSVYGNRFYLWQNAEYVTQNGWAYDECLLDEEKDAVIDLLRFFMEKNDQGELVVDLREQSHEYLYGVVDIPFTHFVNCDGTSVEAVHTEQGTAFVCATIDNIDSLRQRFDELQEHFEKMDQMQYTYSNPLVELILEGGEERDLVFLYLCAKNWEFGSCLNHTLQTRMDSIATGISTTTMHWNAPDTAHIYPAYIPTDSLARKIQTDPGGYGTPFVYKQFVAPYDEAGFRDYLDDDTEMVQIYDLQTEKKVDLFHREKRVISEEILAIAVVGAIIVFIAGALKAMK